jgi:predicted dehydrogenase
VKSIKRRDVLKGALAGTAVGVAPFNILKAGAPPSSKLNIACIGVGGMGSSDAATLSRTDNVIALCDVDEARSRRCMARHKHLHKVKLWTDYRVMFDKIGKQIDAVCIGTPEHVHYAVSMYALKRDKHVYCQKPLCHTVNEVRLLTEEAAKHKKVVTQMGHQGHSGESSAIIRDWGLAGTIGDIREVHAYSRKNYWTDKPIAPSSTPPKTLNWDLFLNRGAKIPFSSSYMNREWIRYSHFSGAVGDMGAHILDPAYYALDIRIPLSVRADVKIPAMPGSLPRAGVITWEFGARGKKPPVTVKYYLGPGIDFPHPKHLEKKRRGITSGSVLVGADASIMAGSHSQGARIIPEATMKATPRAPKKAFRCKGRGHFGNWTLACKGLDTAMSPFEYAGPLSEIIVLGDIALLHPGKTLLWDAKNMKITNDDAANKSLFMRRINPRDDMNWI